MFALLAAKAALGKATAALGRVPWQIWAVVAVIALLGLGSCVHGHKVKAHDKAIIATRDKYWQDKLDKAHLEAMDWKRQAEQKAATISTDIRTRHEETLRADAAAADSLRLHGPGKAGCRQGNNPSVPAASSRSGDTPAKPDAPRSDVPATDSAAVPWQWLVTRAQQCDVNLSEAKSWREWYKHQSEAWPTH